MNRDVHAALGLPALAPRSLRLFAVTLDVALVAVLFFVTLVGATAGGVGAIGALQGPRAGLLQRIGSGGLGAGGMVLAFIAGAALCVLTIYQWYLLATRGQTIGKRVFGIHIVDADTGKPVGFVQALLLRSLVPAVISTGIIALLGWLIPPIGAVIAILNLVPIFGAERRCFHDYLAGTQVRWVEARSALRMRVAVVVGVAAVAAAGVVTLVMSPSARALLPPSPGQLGPKGSPAPAPSAPPSPPSPSPSLAPSPSAVVPAVATVPATTLAPAPTPVEDAVATPSVAPHPVYSWVDGQGTTSFTDNLDTVPAKFRASVRKVDGD